MALCSTLKLEFTDIFLPWDLLAVLRWGHQSPKAMIRALGKLCKSKLRLSKKQASCLVQLESCLFLRQQRGWRKDDRESGALENLPLPFYPTCRCKYEALRGWVTLDLCFSQCMCEAHSQQLLGPPVCCYPPTGPVVSRWHIWTPGA